MTQSAAPDLVTVPREVLDALTEAEDLLGFHEGSAEIMRPGAHPCVWINNEDLERVLKSLRSAIALTSSDLSPPPSSDPEGGARGELQYRPNDCDDWGVIRAADGKVFAVVRRPLDEEEAAEHRYLGTDPFEYLARKLIDAISKDSDGGSSPTDVMSSATVPNDSASLKQHAASGQRVNPACPSDQLTKTPSADHDAGNLRGLSALFVECPRCGGSGFSSPGTGYSDVCSECGGLRFLPFEAAGKRPVPSVSGNTIREQQRNTMGVTAGETAPNSKAVAETDAIAPGDTSLVSGVSSAPNHQPHAVSQGWRDIETAPKDGTKVLAYWFGNDMPFISVIWWRGDKYPDSSFPWRNTSNDGAIGGFGQCHLPKQQQTWRQGPTHWMPLPAPPSPAKTGGVE